MTNQKIIIYGIGAGFAAVLLWELWRKTQGQDPERWAKAANKAFNLSAEKQNNVKALVKEFNKAGGEGKYRMAYILAGTEHESGFIAQSEHGGSAKSYAPFYGRGFAQLTHRYNYEKWGKILGIDLVNNKELANRPDIAARIIIYAMLGKGGSFTGKTLDDYFKGGQPTKAQILGARSIFNGDSSSSSREESFEYYTKLMNAYNSII